jgi:hypothetical protein
VERASTNPSYSVTFRQVCAPADNDRNNLLAVDPWNSTRSPSRAYPTGTT